MRRLDPSGRSHDSVETFLRLRREALGLTLLRAHLAADATAEEVKQRFRRLRGIGRRPSAANGETEAR
jgi:hypothetical protein